MTPGDVLQFFRHCTSKVRSSMTLFERLILRNNFVQFTPAETWKLFSSDVTWRRGAYLSWWPKNLRESWKSLAEHAAFDSVRRQSGKCATGNKICFYIQTSSNSFLRAFRTRYSRFAFLLFPSINICTLSSVNYIRCRSFIHRCYIIAQTNRKSTGRCKKEKQSCIRLRAMTPVNR